MRRLKPIIMMLLPGLIFLLAWQEIVAGNARLEFLFASPSQVAGVAREELAQAAIWRDSFITLSEAALGLFAGTVLGTICGLLLWGNGKADQIARPYLVLFGAIPIFALAPMIIIWFGIGLLSKVVMAGFAVFFVALLQAYDGAVMAACHYAGFATALRAPQRRVIAKIIIPGAWDWVVAGFKLNVGLALMGAFIGEFVSSDAGLGHYILKSGSLYDTKRVIFGLCLLSLLALGLTTLARLTQRANHKT